MSDTRSCVCERDHRGESGLQQRSSEELSRPIRPRHFRQVYDLAFLAASAVNCLTYVPGTPEYSQTNEGEPLNLEP